MHWMNTATTYWLLSSSVIVAETMTDMVRDVGSWGTNTLLAGGLIVTGIVIIALDRRREQARAEERTELRRQFNELMEHHTDSVKAFREERASHGRESGAMRDVLVQVLRENAQAMAALSAKLK